MMNYIKENTTSYEVIKGLNLMPISTYFHVVFIDIRHYLFQNKGL